MNVPMLKYPRTHHIQGSKLQPGDEDLSQVRVAQLRDCDLVIEEKLDGANAGLSFSAQGDLRLQSRGHYLTGGPREKHFARFKTWAATVRAQLHAVLGTRYIVYGEWLYAKHTVSYDALPHWFMEFDVWDREAAAFLSTPRRHALLADTPIVSVPVLHQGRIDRVESLRALIGPSLYKTARWHEALVARASAQGLNVDRVLLQTDPSDAAEGLYIKHERDGVVAGRYKFIRQSFQQAVAHADGHWLDRPIIPNGLAAGRDMLGGSRDD